ncbi:hypothetical protein HFO56_23280 [Rhizobium laguerreae]|uniref:hypothetical protein n=1 Tax=Rhizobium laguerreae TaxID=1076926 RepID=UPI001C8FB9C0|nr:hypothetical protein [Rhizobium laguerreae]MBY3155249.1 hypothetical protein [Rhizobium laguerreae]
MAAIHDVLIAKALTDAIAVCGPPEDPSRLPHRSEQYWLQTFATPDVTPEQMRGFLASFQHVREKCDYGEAASLVNQLIESRDFDPLSSVECLADALRLVTERRKTQTIAASSLCMFAKPAAKVFVVSDLPSYAARLALWTRSDRASPPLLGVPFHADGWEEDCGTDDYATYAQACDLILDDMRASDAFGKALNRFMDHLDAVPGPMRARDGAPLDFIERRLLEKLMTCEGWYIRYWLETEAHPGKLARTDEGAALSGVVSRRPQDVFPKDIATKFGY